MSLKFLYPYWGSEALSASEFFDQVNSLGFDGIEINIPRDPVFETNFYDGLFLQRQNKSDFIVGVQQVLGVTEETPDDYLKRVLERFVALKKRTHRTHL